MSTIVFDMEWNQPVNPDSPLALRLCTLLPFEIIQIGAVRLEDNAHFKAICCLQQYKTLSPRISRLTGITKQDVLNGETFQNSMVRFRDFCGKDPLLLIWGFNDIPILRQNLSFYGLDTGFTNRFYNLQIMFQQQYEPESNLRGLSSAVDFLQLKIEDNYHDSLSDAVYTAEIARHLDLPRGFREYPEYLSYFEGDGDQAYLDCLRYANYTRFESFEDMLADPRIAETRCPYCGSLTVPTAPIFPDSGRMLWTAECSEHGGFLLRVSFKRNRDDSFHASKVTNVLDEAHQEQYQKAAEKAAKPKKAKAAPFRLFIDADACPVISQAVNTAVRRHVPCYLICDTAHQISREGAETITVDKGADSADYAIVARLKPGDLVLTQDYGLAAMCLAKQAKIIDQNGNRYTEDNIDGLLAQRADAARIRRAGGRTQGPPKRSSTQNGKFLSAFHAMIQEAYDEAHSVNNQ